LYAALAPIIGLIEGGAELSRIVQWPAVMYGWLSIFSSGYVLGQIVLPLGVVLLLIVQARTLFREQYRKHWGFAFWAMCLALASGLGLIGLENQQRPVFPKLAAAASRIQSAAEPQSLPPAVTEKSGQALNTTGPTSSDTTLTETRPEPSAAETAKPSPATGLPAEPARPINDAAPEAAGRPDHRASTGGAPEETHASGEATTRKTGTIREKTIYAEKPPTGPADQIRDQVEVADLKDRISSLENEIADLKKRVDTQSRLIRSLLGFLVTEPKSKAAPTEPESETPPEQPAPSAPESDKQDHPPPSEQRPSPWYQDST
jgi:hypothetical protein